MEVGFRVVAGADGDGLPVLGTITSSDSGAQTCVIQWDGGGTTTHGTNPNVSPREQLRIFDNAPSGNRNSFVHWKPHPRTSSEYVLRAGLVPELSRPLIPPDLYSQVLILEFRPLWP